MKHFPCLLSDILRLSTSESGITVFPGTLIVNISGNVQRKYIPIVYVPDQSVICNVSLHLKGIGSTSTAILSRLKCIIHKHTALENIIVLNGNQPIDG